MANWRKAVGYDMYSVSDEGHVRNDLRGKILKQTVSKTGYAYLTMVQGKKHYMRYVHRLVGEAFIPNPDNLPQIDHIDGNKLNNTVSNLRWVSASENRTAYGNEQRAINRQREVVAINETGEKIVFASRQEAAQHFECHPAKIKYGHRYTRSAKKGWIFYKVEDIV